MFSPMYLLGVAIAVCIVSLVIPPEWYYSLVGEQDLMFSNGQVALFESICFGLFWAGFLFARGVSRRKWIKNIKKRAAIVIPPIAVLVPVGLAAALNLYSISIIVGNTSGLVASLTSGQGAAIKIGLNVDGAFTQASIVLICAVWWGWLVVTKVDRWTVSQQMLVKGVLITASLLVVVTCVIKLARFELFPFLVGIAIIRWSSVVQSGRDVGKYERRMMFAMGLGGALVFSVFSLLRGANDPLGVVSSIVGYGPASYNRLSAVLSGSLVYPYGGTGAYIFTFLGNLPFLRDSVSQYIGRLPDTNVVYVSEFHAVSAAGLNGAYNWPTAFGYFLSDMGWSCTLLSFGFGAVAAILWNAFSKGGVFAGVFFLYFAYTILMWSTYNILAQPSTVVYLAMALILSLYERVLRTVSPKLIAARSAV